MKIISLVAEKGGVGRTTLTATLAVLAHLSGAGARATILDVDPLNAVTTWCCRRAVLWPAHFILMNSLEEKIRAIEAAGFDYLFIDTPPSLSPIREEAMRMSDLVLIVTTPGVLEDCGLARPVEVAERLGVPYRILLSRAAFRTRATGDAVLMLSQSDKFLRRPVHNRQPILAAMSTGRTVVETEPDTPGAAEMTDLWASVVGVLAPLPPPQRRRAGRILPGRVA